MRQSHHHKKPKPNQLDKPQFGESPIKQAVKYQLGFEQLTRMAFEEGFTRTVLDEAPPAIDIRKQKLLWEGYYPTPFHKILANETAGTYNTGVTFKSFTTNGTGWKNWNR